MLKSKSRARSVSGVRVLLWRTAEREKSMRGLKGVGNVPGELSKDLQREVELVSEAVSVCKGTVAGQSSGTARDRGPDG